MSNTIPQSEQVRRAAAFVATDRKTYPNRSLHDILDEAGMRFNLTPLDAQALERLFGEEPIASA